MNFKAARFFSSIKGKRVAVIGIGVTNTDVVRLLCEKGAVVSVHDKRERAAIGEVADSLEDFGAKLYLGGDYLKEVDCDILFRTPGMYYLSDFLQQKRREGVVVTSEMEVFFDICPCRTFAITGSDGKTTTSTLIAEMLKAAGYRVHLGGNIGRALLPIVEEIGDGDVAVVELSSFQLISMRPVPDVSVVTNVSPNHLDVHGDMQEYVDSKRNIYAHQGAFGVGVFNADNNITLEMSSEARGPVRFFSRKSETEFGTFLNGSGDLFISSSGVKTRVMNMKEIALPGIHNVENYLAAMAAVKDFVSPEVMVNVAREFRGVEHRIEFVREVGGVKWYNDSIATSPTRTMAGLNSFGQKIILIAGGYDKNIPYEPLAPELVKNVKTLVLTGATAPKIEAALKQCEGFNENEMKLIHAESLESAVKEAAAEAKSGDIVSLSPASASFDCYKNFEERGKHFKQLVNNL